MLLNNFFEIREKSATEAAGKNSITAHVTINKSHKIFEGHFPSQPIVPGVCMIQMIKEILEIELGTKLFLTSAGNIKFLAFINPKINDELKAEINYTTTANMFEIDARLFWGDITFFKIKGNFSNTW